MDENDDDGESITQSGLIDFANTLHGSGGYDWPEAAKSGLALAHSVMREDATTIMLLFTDAPPHLLAVGGVPCRAEIAKLSDRESFGGSGPDFIDWISGATLLSDGDRKAQVFALVYATDVQASLLYLTTMTNGNYYHLKSATSDVVSDLTMHVLLAWMGFANDQDEHFNDIVTTATYRNTDGLRDARKEGDSSLRSFMDSQAWRLQSSHVNFNITLSEKAQGHGTTVVVANPRALPMQALEARYANDAEYRVFASKQLAAIIESNASAVGTHPVYGSLWRAICADRANDARAGLVMAFGQAIDRITSETKRQKMKDWLAQSYDFSAVIKDAISDVAEDEHRDFEMRVSEGTAKRPRPDAHVLCDEDRRLFRTLVDYKMLEQNLQTTLQARIGWQPSKSKVALGPVAPCKRCNMPRSVTIMGRGGICGVCESNYDCRCQRCVKLDNHAECVWTNVTAHDDEKTPATWVECSVMTCRAQYVVYTPDRLRVRPKCYYCLHASQPDLGIGASPTVECTTCLNRMIWPNEYRPHDFDEGSFKCPACVTGLVTVIEYETNVTRMREENGSQWLLRNDSNALEEPFNGRSLFHTISSVKDIDSLASNVEILPAFATSLTIQGKTVQNQEALLSCLRGWVDQRQSESGTCTLCFSDLRKTDLRAACGRRGCGSQICTSCLDGWYGLVHVGGLREAVANPAWIYAWCAGCGFAKEFAERVCAQGAPADVQDWRCGECEMPHAETTERKVAMVMRECPGCSTMTEKISGCDHITCPNCDAHWCFQCGQDVGYDRIYQHMSEEHGGWWDDRDDGDAMADQHQPGAGSADPLADYDLSTPISTTQGGLRQGLTSYGDAHFSLFLRKVFIKALGYSDDALSRPIIGIVNTYSSFNPCHANIPQLIEAVKRGVQLNGGLAVDFPTISLHESFSSPTSMYLRNLMSMDTEEMIAAQPCDAVVLIGAFGPVPLISGDVSAINDELGPTNIGAVGNPGMPEAGLIPIPRKLAGQGVLDILRISDGRMSGTAGGTIVLHISPEAADPESVLGIVRSGDVITCDVEGRVIRVEISDEEILRRLKEKKETLEREEAKEGATPGSWTARKTIRGYRGLYMRSVNQAQQGADFDFLTAAGPPAGQE
ncbi:dihydroxyacid dehydratase [Verticillium alfalfae VaMs.102]|uniref:Dihydroxyacid dehydratase n=1 Tax=Verticillium alfalfae (strain VaMs.102 / ATCC MYA-4576 / FGSC 10136) TaxID=526221 RepID=C9SYV8_VERA1|nr:dihydroxyacid dehydratase [Verticillium alfalfae VaMs.102]EEY23973.1 dihydroxyacid dehydratase [Verticillium alfalfae VaMs.102]